MDTLKTAVVVVLLLAVLYGVYVTLNQPEQEIPEEIAWAQQQSAEPLQVDFGADGGSGISATVGDSAPWSSDHAGGDMHGHDHTLVEASSAAAANAPQTGFSPAPPSIGENNSVAAPQLITSGNGPGGSGAAAGQLDGAGAYPVPPANFADRSAEPSGYDVSNAFPTKQGMDPPSGPAPPSGTNTSVYSPAQPNAGAPTGSYGDPAGLAGNPQMVAASEPQVADSYGQTAVETAGQGTTETSRVDSVIETARVQIEQGQYYEALLTLSFAYNAPDCAQGDRQKLQGWLDPLAGKVIYSKEHLIGAAYQLQAGETLQSVATKHNVPWQLLANINGLRDPAAVQPGMSIKVVPGPFHAEVDVAHNSLTLYAGRLYAGRFAISVNVENLPAAGEYQVNDKQPGHSFYAGNAQTLAPQDPQNPYGGIWIDLGDNVAIHGKSNSPGQSERLGCISLASQDANDLYGILSLGSNVVIRR